MLCNSDLQVGVDPMSMTRSSRHVWTVSLECLDIDFQESVDFKLQNFMFGSLTWRFGKSEPDDPTG